MGSKKANGLFLESSNILDAPYLEKFPKKDCPHERRIVDSIPRDRVVTLADPTMNSDPGFYCAFFCHDCRVVVKVAADVPHWSQRARIGDTLVKSEERYIDSHISENSSRTVRLILLQVEWGGCCSENSNSLETDVVARAVALCQMPDLLLGHCTFVGDAPIFSFGSPKRPIDTPKPRDPKALMRATTRVHILVRTVPGQIGPSPPQRSANGHQATISPEARCIYRLRELTISRRHPLSERQDTVKNEDHARHPLPTTSIYTWTSPSNTHAAATSFTHTLGANVDYNLTRPTAPFLEGSKPDRHIERPIELLDIIEDVSICPYLANGSPRRPRIEAFENGTHQHFRNKTLHRSLKITCTKEQEQRWTLIPDSTGYVGASPPIPNPSSQDVGLPRTTIAPATGLAYARSHYSPNGEAGL
ncbi:hypothetical protein CRG98_027450 [Punica granatum]|uniref:Uncharacterized protein n=1 Tax=Punica granatum TaxID=22663 RepID=A0A2I0J7D8_PUNGR|nr:hypothetical protein CRG98_027450 [Punica granatum]